MEELNELIDELVVKRGPYIGYIKKGQDPDKVGRLVELGYKEPVKKEDGGIEERLKKVEDLLRLLGERTERMRAALDSHDAKIIDHEKRIAQCSIRR